jgi:hypothetical protein
MRLPLTAALLLATFILAPSGSGRPGAQEPERLPEVPKDKLPPLTRPKLDPAKDQYLLEGVHVKIEETQKSSSGEVQAPRVPVIENYLKEYFRRAGHPIVDTPAGASWRIEGSFSGVFDKTLIFRGRTLAWKAQGSGKLRVLDRESRELEVWELPAFAREGLQGEPSAFLEVERYGAKLLWDRLTREGKVFTKHEVVALLESLAPAEEAKEGKAEENREAKPEENKEARAQENKEAREGKAGGETPAAASGLTAEEVARRLAERGLEAVPYLIDALTDTRTVRLPSSYPGLDRLGLEALKVYHVVDKALEDIFQKVSRMDLQTTEKHRYVVIRGWENEWRRFCPPFRESPASPRAK